MNEPVGNEILVRGRDRGPYERAYRILMNTAQSERKEEERRKMLEMRPELRIMVDLDALRKIIDFKSFKCHPKSSIARGMAIGGSDIDAGVVFLEQPISEEEQLEFVRELREQGFDVWHPVEVDEARGRADEAKSTEEIQNWATEAGKREQNRILFITEEELKPLIEGKPDFGRKEVQIWFGGREITNMGS